MVGTANAQLEDEDEDDQGYGGNDGHIDFFAAMTSTDWVRSITCIWSAQMVLHSEDGRSSTLLQGYLPLHDFNDASRKWLLTIERPLVLKGLYTMPSRNSWEWRRLMGRLVMLQLSVTLTEEELKSGHQHGTMVSVLVFASMVPFVWDGKATFLILRRVDAAGTRWARVGRLVMTLEEHLMHGCSESQSMIEKLPVKPYGRILVLV
jgi:hypothetical protein